MFLQPPDPIRVITAGDGGEGGGADFNLHRILHGVGYNLKQIMLQTV